MDAARVSEDEQSRQRFQAILLADSFTTKLLPVNLERPNVLLLLVNVPIINYTLAWLESAGIEQVFVFCSMQVIDYLENSEWYSYPDFSVTTIVSPQNSTSVGDALRYIYEQQLETSQLQGDFVLVSGGTVSNMPLVQLIQEHIDRKKKDDKSIMTMGIKHSSSHTDQQLFIAVDPLTKQLLYYDEDKICLDKSLMDLNSSVLLCSDMMDCYIDICSLEVLTLFEDNFDYQHLRRDFVEGVLADDIMGYKIFTHEIRSSYAARIENFRSYDSVSKDIIQRWTFPYVPDIKLGGNRHLKLGRQGIYRAVVQPGVVLSFKVVVGRDFIVPAYSKVSLFQQPTEEDSDEEHLLSDVDLQKLGHDGGDYIWQVYDEEWKHSVAPIPKDKLVEIIQAMDDDDTEDENADSGNTDVNDPYDFETEVEGTFLRALEENILVDLAILEINSLRLSYNMESATCAGAIFYSMMKLAVDTPHSSAKDLYRNTTSIITRWKGLLGFYVKQSDEQIEVISRFEEMCQESAQQLGPLFNHILRFLYEEENDILQEVAIFRWADEKADADESDKVYLKQCQPFIMKRKAIKKKQKKMAELVSLSSLASKRYFITFLLIVYV